MLTVMLLYRILFSKCRAKKKDFAFCQKIGLCDSPAGVVPVIRCFAGSLVSGLHLMPLLEHDEVFLGARRSDHDQVGIAVRESRAVLGGFQVRQDHHLLV